MADNFEFAWLIEKGEKEHYSGPLYYAMSEFAGEEEYWTTDPYKAVRFSRQQDAEDMIRGFKIANATAIEHGWDARWHSQS